MKGIPYEVATITQLPECWIWKNRHYILKTSKTPTQIRESSLPRVRKEYEPILKELGIPYRVTLDEFENEVFEYWNPAAYEEETVRLPVYTKMGKNYKYVGKYHTEKKATLFAVKNAEELERQVGKAIEEFEEKKRKEEFFKLVKESLGERQAILFYDETNDVPIEMDYVCGEDRFKAMPIIIPAIFRKGWSGHTYWYACFNVNKIELNSVVKLEKVPKGKAGMVIGFNGWQTKEWCRKLGVKFIQVVEN